MSWPNKAGILTAEQVALEMMCTGFRHRLRESQLSSINATDPGQARTNRSQSTIPSANNIPSPSSKREPDKAKTDDALALGVATVECFRDPNFSDQRQRDGIAEWKAWMVSDYDLDPDDWYMEEVAVILSKIFFLKAPRHNIYFQWQGNLPSDEGYITRGDTAHMSDDGIRVRVDPTDDTSTTSVKDHKRSLLSFFAHELTHAIFMSWCCDGAKCHINTHCTRNGVILWPPKGEGDGHHFGWFLAACNFDVRVEDLIGIQLDLASFSSLISHCKAGGKVSAEDWKLFFSLFTQAEVEKLFGYLYKDDNDGPTNDLRTMLMKDERVMQVWGNQFLYGHQPLSESH